MKNPPSGYSAGRMHTHKMGRSLHSFTHGQQASLRRPAWIKVNTPLGCHATKRLLRRHGITTVCEEARCPNIADCFARPAATFLILGSKCTRNCGFCSVESSPPELLNPQEPEMVARAAQDMSLRHVVVTSVTRDDLSDGGAAHFARTIQMIRQYLPDTHVEVLTPDFQGKHQHLSTVLDASPDVFNHNVETVPRLYPSVRPGADYPRSLGLLARAKKRAPDILIKSGFMLGLGETPDEILEVLSDLKGAGCDIVTIGQYLRPSRKNIPVISYIRPETFESIRECALDMGFLHVASGPLVRSSMNADEIYRSAASRVS